MSQLKRQPSSSRRASIKQEDDEENASEAKTAKNTQGMPCAIKKQKKGPMKGKWFFESQQYCSTCKKDAYHLPQYCPQKPENKKRKLEAMSKAMDNLRD